MAEAIESGEPAGGVPVRDAVVRLALAVVVAFALRAVLLWLRGDFLDYDEAMYLLLARNLGDGAGFTLNGLPHSALGPLVPAATAGLARLFGLELLTGQRTLAALSGALLIVPVWYLLRRQGDGRVAWIAVALVAVWPALIDVAPRYDSMWLDNYAGTEPTFLLFLFASLAIGEAALKRRGWPALPLAALAGATLAFAYMTRAEAVVFGGLYAAVRAVQLIRESGGRRGVVAAAAAALGFLVVAAPQFVQLRRATGAWTISGQPAVMRPAAATLQELFRDRQYRLQFGHTWYRLNAGHTYLTNPYWGTPDGVSRELQERQYAAVAADEAPVSRTLPARVWNRLANYAYMIWTVCGVLFLPFALIGIVTARRRGLPAFALAGLAASLVTGVYLAVLPRFFLYLVPVFALWAAYGIIAIVGWLGRFRDVPTGIIVAVLAAVSLLSVGSVALGGPARVLASVGGEDRSVAEELGDALPAGEPVMHWHPKFAYWGGWDWRAMPLAELDDMAHYAAAIDLTYILLARGGYTPVRAEVPFLLIVVDSELARALRSGGESESEPHIHPPTALRPAGTLAGQPVASLELGDGQLE
jgi:hypothetical protein